MGSTSSFIDLMFQSGFTSATKATVSYTPSCASAPANMQTGSDALLKTIDGNGSVTTLAGKAITPPLRLTDPLVDGSAADARFALGSTWGNSEVVTDGTNLYVLDQDYYAIRKVDIATGYVSTLVGGSRGSGDGTGTAASFYAPNAMTIDDTHTYLYVSDFQHIRKIEIATGIVTTLPITIVDTTFAFLSGLATEGNSLYVLDSNAASGLATAGRIVKIDLTSLAVTNWMANAPIASGPVFQSNGNLYLLGNNQVVKVNIATLAVSGVAGGMASVSRDGIGAQAGFNNKPRGLTSDGLNLYVADNSAIRKIELATGIVSTIAGSNTAGYADGTGAAAKFGGLGGIAMVGTYLYAADNYSAIRRIQTNGTGGVSPSPIGDSTVTTGPMAGTWSYSSPGGAAWSAVTDATVPNGGAVYKAAPVAQDQSTIASITVTQTGNGVVSFYKKVSSMACCDYLVFTIDGVEPANARWSGNVAWSQTSFALTAGTHTLRWSYVKGNATYVNPTGVQDTAWISQVAVTAAPPVVSGLAPASGAVGSLSKILGSDLNNFAPLPTVNFNAGNTNYPAITPYALSADYSSLEFAVPQDLAAGDYSITLGNGTTDPLIAGTFNIPALGTQMGGARQGVALNLGSSLITVGSTLGTIKGATTDGINLYVADGVIKRVSFTAGEVTTLAGGAAAQWSIYGGVSYCTAANGIGAAAAFCSTGAMTNDGTNLYVADDYAIRKVVIATGEVTTFPVTPPANLSALLNVAGGLSRPSGLTTDGTYLYITYAINPVIMKVSLATGAATWLAGSTRSSIVDGVGSAAFFASPTSITTDGKNLYLIDVGVIRKVDPVSGAVTTLIGTPTFVANVMGITTDGTSLYASNSSSIIKVNIATSAVTLLPAGTFIPLTTDGATLYGALNLGGNFGNTISKVQVAQSAGTTATTPTIVSTTVWSAAKASLKWTPVAGSTTYNVYRSTSPNVALTAANKVNALTGPVTALEYTDSTLSSATTYYYKVTGITATGETAASSEIWLKTLAAPNAPTGLTAVASGTTKIDLSWTAITDAVGYNVYQSRSPSVQLTTTNKLAVIPTGTTAQITGLYAGTLYYYKVTAVNANGESIGSAEVSATTTALPGVPTGVSATSVNATQINVSWTAVTGAASYNVYRSNNSALVGNTTQTTYSDTGLTPSTSYGYFVRAANAAGEVSINPSTVVSATTAALPSTPTGITGTTTSATQFDIGWTNVTGATGYNVYRSASPNVQIIPGNKINTAPLTVGPFSDTALTAATTYYYKVTSVNAAGESLGSLEVSVSPPMPTIAGLKGGTIQLAALNLANTVSTLPGLSALLSGAQGVTTDGTNLYVVDSTAMKVYKIVIATGVVTTLAGDGTSSAFNYPVAITTDGANLYVAQTGNHSIQRIVIATGAVTTLAGGGYGSRGAWGDAVGTAAFFNNPQGITTDGTTLYVADTGNGMIRKVEISTGAVTTLAGGGIGSASFGSNTLHGIVTDGANLYLTDLWANKILKFVISTGVVTTLAGSGVAGAADGIGTTATFNNPIGITTDGINLYVSELSGYKIRKVVIATGAVTTVAGAGTRSSLDGVGAAAKFFAPAGMTTDGTNLYVADGNAIRKIQ